MNTKRIEPGDVVTVSMHAHGIYLWDNVIVLNIPQATGDSWIFDDKGALHYVTEPITVTKERPHP